MCLHPFAEIHLTIPIVLLLLSLYYITPHSSLHSDLNITLNNTYGYNQIALHLFVPPHLTLYTIFLPTNNAKRALLFRL